MCKQTIVKENEKNICIKEICKIFKIYGWTFFPANVFSLLGRCQLYIIAKYKASNCFKTEAVIQRCSGKKALLNILKNLQENPSSRVSFLIKFKRQRCFPVNIAKFFRSPFFIEHLVAASGKIRPKPLKSAKFQFQLFFTTLASYGLPLHCDKIVVKLYAHRKMFVVESIHIAIQTSKHLNKVKIQFAVTLYSTVEVSVHSQGLWCFEIVFWMIWMLKEHVSV